MAKVMGAAAAGSVPRSLQPIAPGSVVVGGSGLRQRQQLGDAVKPRDRAQAVRKPGEDELPVAVARLAQPGEQHGERRGIELAQLAEVDDARPALDLLA